MSVTGVGKTLSNISENIVKVFEEGCNIATDPNHTEEDVTKFWRDLENVGKGSTEASLNEAQTQAKEATTRRLVGRGWSQADIEIWFNPRWEKIKNAAEKTRTTVPTVEKAAHSVWRNLVGFVGGIAALATATVIYGIFNSGPTPEEQAVLNLLRHNREEQMQIQRLSEIMISAEEFRNLINSLAVSTAPTPTTEIPLPVAVQVVAAAPVHVNVTTPTGTREFTSNIERVYQNSPEPVRRRIEETLVDPPEDRVPPDHSHHKTFTVGGTPFGSATFSY